MLPVKHGIPVPLRAKPGPKGVAHPFVELNVGDSFYVPIPPGTAEKTVLSGVRTAHARWRKYTGLSHMKFRIVATNEPDTNARVVGVWRTK